MDENKTIKLREIGYKIGPACGLCSFGKFGTGSDWGECHRHLYNHKKHTNPDGSPLSIHQLSVQSGLSNPGFNEFLV